MCPVQRSCCCIGWKDRSQILLGGAAGWEGEHRVVLRHVERCWVHGSAAPVRVGSPSGAARAAQACAPCPRGCSRCPRGWVTPAHVSLRTMTTIHSQSFGNDSTLSCSMNDADIFGCTNCAGFGCHLKDTYILSCLFKIKKQLLEQKHFVPNCVVSAA